MLFDCKIETRFDEKDRKLFSKEILQVGNSPKKLFSPKKIHQAKKLQMAKILLLCKKSEQLIHKFFLVKIINQYLDR